MKREVVARIDSGALANNLSVVRRHAPGTRVTTMVKANAYGHGLVPVSRALLDAGADALGVAVVEEALALRDASIRAPVIVVEGAFSSADVALAVEHRLDLVCHQSGQVAQLLASRLDLSGLKVWLKIETGMHRLGLPLAEAGTAVERLKPRLQHLGVMTHLACADEPDHPLNATQLAAVRRFAHAHGLRASVANSAAILSHPASAMDEVRPGIMLYGASPFAGREAQALDLEPVMTLSARVIALNELREGETVGYGATWQAARPTRLAVIGAGYGDGYPRHAPSGTPVLLGGQPVLTAGRVSMDMIAVDVTDHPGAHVGDEAVLWGKGLSADRVAAHAGTISYELFCRLTPRVRFEYPPA